MNTGFAQSINMRLRAQQLAVGSAMIGEMNEQRKEGRNFEAKAEGT